MERLFLVAKAIRDEDQDRFLGGIKLYVGSDAWRKFCSAIVECEPTTPQLFGDSE
jgi:hypothetical protein